MAGKLRVGYYLDDGIFPPTPGVVRVCGLKSKFTLENWTWVVQLCFYWRVFNFFNFDLEWYIWISSSLEFALQVRAVQEVVDRLKEDGHHVRFTLYFHFIPVIFPSYQRGRPSCEISILISYHISIQLPYDFSIISKRKAIMWDFQYKDFL